MSDDSPPEGTVDFEDEQFVVRLKTFDRAVVAAIRELHQRRWSPEKQAWLVGGDKLSAEGLLQIASTQRWKATKRAFEVLENCRALPEPPPKFGVDLEEDDGRPFFVMRFAYDAALVSLMKRLPGRRYNDRDKSWRAPADATETCGRLLRLVEDDRRFVVTEPAGLRLEAGRSWVEQPSDESEDDEVPSVPPMTGNGEWVPSARNQELQSSSFATRADAFVVEGLGEKLYDFQLAGVRYLCETKRAILADEMGLGKTPQALATLEKTGSYPALILCPTAVKMNWQHEVRRWLPRQRSVSTIKDRKTPPENTDVVITTYELAHAHLTALTHRRFQAIVADESHYIKSREAKRTKAAIEIAAAIPLRLALSGTPFPRSPVDLASQLQFLGRLEPDFGGFWAFASRYCKPVKTEYGTQYGSSNEEELARRLRATCYCRREKSVVLSQLPPKERHTQWIELADPTAYGKVEAQINRRLEAISSAAKEDDPQSKGFRARSAMRTREIHGCAENLRSECGKQKIKGAIAWLENVLDSGEALVVFAHHRAFQEALVRHFPTAGHILATDSPEARDNICRRFQAGEFPLVICSLMAAGIGITLTRAAHVVFAELDWIPATHQQAEDRLHRIGQARAVTAWYLVGEESIDVRILHALERRWSTASVVNTSTIDEIFGAAKTPEAVDS